MDIILKRMAGVMLLLLVCVLSVQPASAQSKPRWAQKGEKSLDNERISDGYYFKVFNTYGMDVSRLRTERFNPLLTHLRERYGIAPDALTLDSVYAGADSSEVTYRITFPQGDGSRAVVYARRVDEYCAYEDYVDNTYQFEFYQLYAVTDAGRTPDAFDDFEVTNTYNAQAAVWSLVPGLGQIYKGQTTKGYVILGAEATLVAGAVVFSIKKHSCDKMIDREPQFADSWRSKSSSWRTMRNICIGMAGGLYVYNLIDAAVSKGARQVIVSEPRGRQLSLVPMASYDGAGISLVIDF